MKNFTMQCPGHPKAILEAYLLDCDQLTLGQNTARPAIVVCPGGGYLYCSRAEGEPVAMSYAARGFHAFVLRYSTGWDAAGFSPLQEISWAIGYIRQHAQQWNVDPDKIISCGFSAGGHLALAAGLMAEHKPNAMILGYPATSAPAVPGADFMLKLLTGKQTVTAEDAANFDLVQKVHKDAPPVFIAATGEDMLTSMCSLPLAQKYASLGLNYELHIFRFGPHGYSLGNETSANGSSRYLDRAFAQWQNLSVDWVHRTLGELSFVDKSNSKMGQYLKEMGVEMPEF